MVLVLLIVMFYICAGILVIHIVIWVGGGKTEIKLDAFICCEYFIGKKRERIDNIFVLILWEDFQKEPKTLWKKEETKQEKLQFSLLSEWKHRTIESVISAW